MHDGGLILLLKWMSVVMPFSPVGEKGKGRDIAFYLLCRKISKESVSELHDSVWPQDASIEPFYSSQKKMLPSRSSLERPDFCWLR